MTRLQRVIEGWFSAPAAEGAGTYGLFRIVYGLFALWFVSVFDPRVMPLVPRDEGTPPVARVFGWEPSVAGWERLDMVLVAALVLLTVGLWTRPMTAVVLVTGLAREGLLTGPLDVEASHPPLVFWIPLLMLVFGRWGETWSLDALRRRRLGRPVTDPHDPHWTHALPARTLLVLVAALFTTSPLFKVLSGGVWLEDTRLLQNMLLRRHVLAEELGYFTTPFPPLIADLWPLALALQAGVMAFEGLFFLVLFDRRLRTWFLSTAVLFHAANALLLLIGFAPVLIVYAVYVPWQRLADRLPRRTFPVPDDRVLAAVAVLVALILGATWWDGPQAIFDLGGFLGFRTWPLLVAPIAFVVWIRATIDLGGLARSLRTRQLEPFRRIDARS